MTEAADTIWLASASPRRRALLEQIGIDYRAHPVELDERPLAGETPEALVWRLARAKADAALDVLGRGEGLLVLGADTAVVIDGEVLGKPGDRAQGLEMLGRLSGRTHEVLTAVALLGRGGEALRLSTSRVSMRAIDPAERAAYWATGEPRDKAGAYAVQGLAAAFIERLEGSYSGVMGLPLFETSEMLRSAGVRVLG